MTENSCVIAIDIGTSSVRAAIFDLCGMQIGPCAQRSYALSTCHDGRATISHDELLTTLCAVIDETLIKNAAKNEICAVGLSSFWHSLVGLDENRHPTMPIWTWADRRSASQADFFRVHVAEKLNEITGCPIHSSFWLSRIAWLSKHNAEVFNATATWCSAVDFLLLQFFGQLYTSFSMASGTGLFDLEHPRWNEKALSIAGITEDSLPLVSSVPYQGLQRTYRDRWPQLRDIPWFPAIGDGACSNVGSGCTTNDALVLMLGTSGSMRVLWDSGKPNLSDSSLWCFRLDERRYAGGMALSEGGAAASWALKLIDRRAHPLYEHEVSAMSPDSHGLTILPFFLGSRSPDWVDGRTACISGITAATTPLEIYRATLESIGLRFAILKRKLDRAWPQKRRIIATGAGFQRSPIWGQIVADCLGEEIYISGAEEGSLRGAALLAWEQLKTVSSLGCFTQPINRVVSPDSNAHSKYAEATQKHELFDRLLNS